MEGNIPGVLDDIIFLAYDRPTFPEMTSQNV